MIKAVIVDFDDTLCLTEEACYILENELLEMIGHKPQTRSIHLKTWGQPLFEAIKVRSPGVDVVKFRKAFNESFQGWVDEGRIDAVTEENLRVLDRLLDQGKQVFVLTSRTHDELKHILAPDHHLAERIKAFYYRDVMQFHKPDPRAFEQLLKGHKLKPGECVYVGDSPSDAQAAKGAGIHFIASLEAGLRTRKDFAKERVEYFIDRFDRLNEAIAEIGEHSKT